MLDRFKYGKPHFWWLWLCFVFIVSVIPSQQTGNSGWVSQFHLDKIFHLLSHAIAIFFIFAAFIDAKPPIKSNIKLTFGLVFMLLFGIFIELFQANYVQGRMFDIMDIVANITGDVLGLSIFLILNNR